MTTVLLVSGAGRFADPWHPFPETSAALRSALEARGCDVTPSEDAEAALASLGDGPLPSLLVVNIGWYGAERFSEPATSGLVGALRRGLPTMLVHSTLTAFPQWPLWQDIAGGGWAYDVTYHPDYGPGLALARPEHPVTSGLAELKITDERYTKLWVADSSEVYLEHDEAGQRHPLAWTRTWANSPVLADALGHDAGAYAGADRQRLLQRELDRLLPG